MVDVHGTPALTSMHGAGSYSGGRTADAFMSFIKGKLAEDKGFARVPALDRLASAFPHEARTLPAQRTPPCSNCVPPLCGLHEDHVPLCTLKTLAPAL